MPVEKVEQIDLTPPDAQTRELDELKDGQLAIIGTPVYAGRIPPQATGRLQRLKANGTPAVVVVLYGNREYEDALLELNNIVVEAGFKPVAAGAFIGEHSFSSKNTPIAEGRPDKEDLNKAGKFGKEIMKNLKGIEELGDISPLKIPGNFPYREWREHVKVPPATDETLCIKCATCVAVCPVAAIVINDRVMTDASVCIFCCACVKNCPAQARALDNPQVQRIAKWLSKNYSQRKEPETYFA
jgi:ferredoxin